MPPRGCSPSIRGLCGRMVAAGTFPVFSLSALICSQAGGALLQGGCAAVRHLQAAHFAVAHPDVLP